MKNKTFLNAVLILYLILNSGCASLLVGAVVGAGSVVYFKGNLQKVLDSSVDEVHKASLRALRELDVVILDERAKKHSAWLKGLYVDNKKVSIKIKAITEKACNITIRVGALGDEVRTRMILNTIEKKLKSIF